MIAPSTQHSKTGADSLGQRIKPLGRAQKGVRKQHQDATYHSIPDTALCHQVSLAEVAEETS